MKGRRTTQSPTQTYTSHQRLRGSVRLVTGEGVNCGNVVLVAAVLAEHELRSRVEYLERERERESYEECGGSGAVGFRVNLNNNRLSNNN